MKKVKKAQTAFLPTPLHKLENLTREVGKAEMFIKRDDLTGIGLGGNKLRKLDYIVQEALDEGCTTLLTYGGVQTNHGRLTAAAAAKFGMKSIIMCYGNPPEKMSGNLVLDRIMGAELVFMNTDKLKEAVEGKPYDEIVSAYQDFKKYCTDSIIEKYEKEGHKVKIVPIGGHSHAGTLGYVDCVKEIMDQLEATGDTIDYVVTGNGSLGTYAGLLLGAKYHNAPFKIKAVNISKKPLIEMEHLIDHMNETSELYDMDVSFTFDELDYNEEYTGIGYNIPDEETRKVIYRLASAEGVLVDPCYTGKSFAGFLGLIEREIIPADSKALFIHTGGTPGIWTEEHLEEMNKELWTDIQVFEYQG